MWISILTVTDVKDTPQKVLEIFGNLVNILLSRKLKPKKLLLIQTQQ